MVIDLKPCPFCGGQAVVQQVCKGYREQPPTLKNKYQILCLGCGARTREYEGCVMQKNDGEVIIEATGATEAAMAWNRRM